MRSSDAERLTNGQETVSPGKALPRTSESGTMNAGAGFANRLASRAESLHRLAPDTSVEALGSGTESRAVALERVIEQIGPVTVAVSGGVDSMTLAVVAHRVLGDSATMVHAVSPAVPVKATERVERYARREGWRLESIDAGELLDARYVANPVNRCYFCKMNLYSAIALLAGAGTTVVSGANSDDLGDFRPGLAGRGRARSPPSLRRVRNRENPRFGPSQPGSAWTISPSFLLRRAFRAGSKPASPSIPRC